MDVNESKEIYQIFITLQKAVLFFLTLLNDLARVTRLGDLSPFGRLFKAHGDNYFDPNRPNFWRLFGRFLKDGSNLNFLCYKENLNLKF